MTHGFYTDAANKAAYRKRTWYKTHLMPALLLEKENRVRDIDTTIALTQKLLDIYDEPLEKPKPVEPHVVIPREDGTFMKPIEPEILDLLYGSTEKGAAGRYLKARYKKHPEENFPILKRFYFRVTSNWDYGWQQKEARMRARDVNRGRCRILRDTFYRKNNLAPDPVHYAQPAGAEFSICSEYSCNFS